MISIFSKSSSLPTSSRERDAAFVAWVQAREQGCHAGFLASDSQPKRFVVHPITGDRAEINSVDYPSEEKAVPVIVTRLSLEQMAQLEKQFPQPVVSQATTPLEAAAGLARQQVFKVLRDGFVTTR